MEWIEFDNNKYSQLMNETEANRIMVYCDNKQCYRYNEDWGINIVTHFLILPTLPN